MNYVLDASVLIKWYVPEIYTSEAIKLIGKNHTFHIPELILTETAGIVWKMVRRGDLSSTEGNNIVNALLKIDWNVYSHQPTLISAYAGAQRTDQTVYDFTYMSLAISIDCEFVTADEKFYRALEKTPFRSNLKWIGDF